MAVYGQCTNCGALEVELIKQTGTQDLSSIGEDPKYPYGPGCEVCAGKPAGWRSATAPTNWKRGTTYAETRNLAL